MIARKDGGIRVLVGNDGSTAFGVVTVSSGERQDPVDCRGDDKEGCDLDMAGREAGAYPTASSV